MRVSDFDPEEHRNRDNTQLAFYATQRAFVCVIPSLVDKEATAQEVSPKVRYLSWLSLATLFLDSFSFPGRQSTWSHLLPGPHKK